MPTLSGSIEADVPIEFADREWREFIGRSVYGRFPEGYEGFESDMSEIEAEDGHVSFLESRDGRVRVTVELEYTPHDPVDPGSDVARAQRELNRDLDNYRTFVMRRCDEVQCANN